MTIPRIPSWLVRLAQAAVAVALLALLWRVVDGPAALRSLAAADPGWLALAFLALTLQTVLSALRWQVTAGQLGIRLAAGHAVREYYLAQLVNQSLPGGVLGDAGRAVRARAQAGLLASGQAVVLERLAGQAGLFALLALAFLATLLVPGGFEWPGWMAFPVAALVAGGAALPLLLALARRLPGAPGRRAQGAWQLLARTLAAPAVLRRQVALSLGTAACNVAAFAFCARAVGVDVPLPALAALVPLVLFAMVLPVSFSGWGLREGAAAALLPVAGIAASSALAASIAFGLVFLAAALPGAAMLLVLPPARHAGS